MLPCRARMEGRNAKPSAPVGVVVAPARPRWHDDAAAKQDGQAQQQRRAGPAHVRP